MENPTPTPRRYFTPGQLETMSIAARDTYIVAARGSGKSHGIDAPTLLRNTFEMPASVGALLSPTYKKLKINTLPAVSKALASYGYHRDIHYFVGRKAPARMGFKMPHTEPFDWSYCIHWFNGSIQNMISFDQNMSANSMSLDYVMGFEAKFLDYDKVKSEVLPANRGNRELYGDCPWHHGSVYTTDMPTSRTGSWILDMRERMDTDLIGLIRDTFADLQRARIDRNQPRVADYEKKLTALRRRALFYAEYSAFDNFDILGSQYFIDMKRDLPPLLFSASILNIRPGKPANAFYSSLDPRVHYYTANNNSYLASLPDDVQSLALPEDYRHDADLDTTVPLAIANDYNAAINSLVVGQVQGRIMRTVRSLYVKTPRKLVDLTLDFCAHYRNYPNRDIIYYYDATAIYASSLTTVTFAQAVADTLRANNWNVTEVYIGQPPRHDTKHHAINQALKGDQKYLFPLFNRDNNPYLLPAMEQAGIRMGRNSFEKDKSAERDADSPESPDEKKTHITDAWDTLFIGLNEWPATAASVPLTTRFSR